MNHATRIGSDAQVEMGHRIRTARQAAGMSQLELAEQTNISRVAVAEIEAGRRKVSSFELAALSRSLARPGEYFLGTVQLPEEKFGGSSSTVMHLARAARQLKPEDQEQLLRFAQYLKSQARRRAESSQ